MKYLYRHTRAFRRVLGRSKKFKKGKSRAKDGGVVISEQYNTPIKNQGVFLNAYTPVLSLLMAVSRTSFGVQGDC